MKKQQFLKITLILVITFTAILSSCSEDVYQENLIQKARDYHFKKINFQELKEINNQAFIETAKLKKVVPADKYNSIQSISNFDIDLQNIQYLKKTNNHETFSFRVLQLPNATFSQNIVVDCKPNQTPQTYLITYYLNKQLGQIDNTNEFINSITSTLTTKIDYSSNGNTTNSGGRCVEVGYYEEVDACEGELVTPGEKPNCFNSDGSRKTILVFKVIAADCSTGGSSSFNPLISQWDYNNGNTNSYNNSHGGGGGGESNESFNIFVPNYYNSGDLSDPSTLNMIQINQFIYSLYSTNNDVRNVVESTEWLLAYTNYWIGINGGLTLENQNALTYAFNNIPSVFYQHSENNYNLSQISLFQYNALQLLIKHGEWLSNLDIQTQQNILQNINSIENIEFVDELIDLASQDAVTDNNALNFVLQAQIQNKIENDLDEVFIESVNQYVNVNTTNPILTQQLITYFTVQCAVLRYNHPTWSDTRIYWEASKELIHISLDALGLVPVVGEVADLTNGVLYTIEGDGVNATLSYASAVPVAGWAAAGTKMAIKIKNVSSTAYTVATKVKLTWKIIGGVVTFGDRAQLRKVLGMGTIAANPRQAHHIIPWAQQTHPAIQKAAKSGSAFHMNEALNGIPLSTVVHNGSHTHYDNLVQGYLNAIPANATPQQAYNKVVDLINDIRTAIANNPNTPINQLNF